MIVSRAEQPSKEPSPISVIALGSLMLLSLEHSVNAYVPISVTESATETDDISAHWKKAYVGISVIPSVMLTPFMESLYSR